MPNGKWLWMKQQTEIINLALGASENQKIIICKE